MKLYELKEGEIKLTEVPEYPEILNEYGQKCWDIYCEALLERSRLFREYLPGLETLCWLEQKIQGERVKEESGFTRVIKEFSVEARQYRKAYGFTEDSRPKIADTGSGSAGKQSKSKAMTGFGG